jgi:hypothetical protein
MRRRLAVSDSLSIQNLTQAYFYKDSALTSCQSAIKIEKGITKDNQEFLAIREKELKESKKEIKARLILQGISLGSTQIMITSRVEALYSHVTEAVIQPSQADGFVFSRGTSQDKSEATFAVDNNKVT